MRDPDDDAVIATALAAQADIIVTGDNDLLVLHPYEVVTNLEPH
ncbi:MAG: putative toxin-antitoxin system toxin component, PIN family [Halioglobus sp.]|nr:putative toxin-antitoxin system toxin component, PIN family [Halioglobus sp.]